MIPPRVAHLLGGQLVLLVALVVHEDELVALAVEVLGVDLVDVGRLDRIAALPGAIDGRAADEVLQAALVQGLALARLHEIALDHQIGVAVELDLQALLEIAGVDGAHVRFSVSLSGMRLVCYDWLSMGTSAVSLESGRGIARVRAACWRRGRGLANHPRPGDPRSGRTLPPARAAGGPGGRGGPLHGRLPRARAAALPGPDSSWRPRRSVVGPSPAPQGGNGRRAAVRARSAATRPRPFAPPGYWESIRADS